MNTTYDYTRAWQVADSLEQQGLPKSALVQVQDIALHAREQGRQDQMLRTVMYQAKYTVQLEEDGLPKAIQFMEQEEQKAPQPAKAIYQSALGELYATYLSHQGWQISRRTPLENEKDGDILTLSAAALEQRAIQYYVSSTQPQDLLYATPITDWQEVIIAGQWDSINGIALRPTLYDLLAHRAIEHLNNDRNYLTEPTYRFQLQQATALGTPEAFIAESFATRDSTSGKWMTIRLFQELTRLRLSKGTPAQLGAVILDRLSFAYRELDHPDKEKLYEQALKALSYRKGMGELDAEIACALAEQQFQMAQDEENNVKNPQLVKEALALCEKAVKAYPKSVGAAQCRQLMAQINEKRLKVQVEQDNLPYQNILMSVAYKNTSQCHYQIVQLPIEKDHNGNEDELAYLQTLPVLYSGQSALKDPEDFKEHRTELPLNALDPGRYAVLLREKKDGPVTDYAEFICSQLAAVRLTSYQAYTEWAIVDRATGAPVQGAAAQERQLMWLNDHWETKNGAQAISDENGMVRFSTPVNISSYLLITRQKDQYATQQFQNYQQPEPSPTKYITFFTDRGLYRPGQMVYFKGIVLHRSAQLMPRILPRTRVTVRLLDANQQERGKMDLTSNEFGSFNGVFTLPTGALTGSFSLSAQFEGGHGYSSFQVEEYKRPKFEVTFDTLKGSWRLNDIVKISGKAMNYAGNPSDQSEVRWRVTRSGWFPWWMRYGHSPENQIAQGVTTTGADGAFQLQFDAIPGEKSGTFEPPAWSYVIHADITDASGETRSASTTVQIGKQVLVMNMNIPDEPLPGQLKKVELVTENLSGQKTAAQGTITAQAVAGPDRIFRTRYFGAPDILTMRPADFRKQFPSYAWDNEDKPDHWKPVGAPQTFAFNTGESAQLDLSSLAPGYYKLTMKANDAFGTAVTWEKNIRIKAHEADFILPTVKAVQEKVEPGQTAAAYWGGKANALHALFLHARPQQEQKIQWGHQPGDDKAFRVPVIESDRGGMWTYWAIIYDNRAYTGVQHWDVPWSNKELNISFETFRDKLQPGSKEEWRLRISGPGKEKVAAELAASMYDASLDQFKPFQWAFSPYPYFHGITQPYAEQFGVVQGYNWVPEGEQGDYSIPARIFPTLNWFGFPMYGGYGYLERSRVLMAAPMIQADMEVGVSAELNESVTVRGSRSKATDYYIDGIRVGGNIAAEDNIAEGGGKETPAPFRTNLAETVFFFPDLHTDANGDVVLKFKMNEALTRWKLQVFAHSPSLQYALAEKTVVTQKDLMITANPPRFFRAGDEIEFAAKVTNLTEQETNGQAYLMLLDANTLQPLEKSFGLTASGNNFQLAAGQSTAVRWKLNIPTDFTGAVTWRVLAESGAGRDGEESTVPVITNKTLVTETLPMSLRGGQSKTFEFTPWAPSETRIPLKYSLEFTSNPAWYAVQSLPYLMEYPHECSEQMFSRFYANTLAQAVTQKMPAIRRVFDRWKGTDALASNLTKNQELKNALLEETPWVLDAQDETRRQQQIALLFDLNRMSSEREKALSTLAQRQSANGGWPWFPGSPESWGITQHIAIGMEHLLRLNALQLNSDATSAEMLRKATAYCQQQAQKHYDELQQDIQKGKAKAEDNHLDPFIVQYLYLRSFHPEQKESSFLLFYKEQMRKHWKSKNLYEQGILALIAHRNGDAELARQIVQSLRERAMVKEELGMYWPNQWGMYWYQLPIETQAIMVEVFNEAAADREAVDNLRIWLLKNRQTNRWESTKATSEAVYALLMTGDNWLNNTANVEVKVAGKAVRPAETAPGSGYFKQTWEGSAIQPSWNTIAVKNPGSTIVWGAAYRQYLEDLDKVTANKTTGLTIDRQVFRVVTSDKGQQLEALKAGSTLRVGDQLRVRVEIRTDRAMEYVHLKDLRPSGCEPVNVLSGYRYADGLGYYESTRDVATHFFMDYVPRGTYVLEYPMVVAHKGNMSFGMATLQCMYAPEFNSHSAGIRAKVE